MLETVKVHQSHRSNKKVLKPFFSFSTTENLLVVKLGSDRLLEYSACEWRDKFSRLLIRSESCG